MTPSQLDALDAGYTYSLLWVAGIAVVVGAAALGIGFTARRDRERPAHPRSG